MVPAPEMPSACFSWPGPTSTSRGQDDGAPVFLVLCWGRASVPQLGSGQKKPPPLNHTHTHTHSRTQAQNRKDEERMRKADMLLRVGENPSVWEREGAL